MKLRGQSIIALSTLLLVSALPLPAQNSAEPIHPASTSPDIYFGAQGGGVYMQDMQVHVGSREEFKFDIGTRFDLVVGYNFARSWAVELDAGVIWNAINSYGSESFSGTKADLYQFPVLVNYLYRLPIGSRLQGFVGGGIGAVVGDFHIKEPGLDFRDSDVTFGFQGLAGLNYHLSRIVDLSLTYKFLGTTGHKWSDQDFYTETQGSLTHAVLLGVAFKY